MHRAIYGAARRQGVRVLLDGIDGDSAVDHGWARLLDLARSDDWTTFVTQLGAASKMPDVATGSLLRAYAYPLLVWLACRGEWRSWMRGAGALSRHFGMSRAALFAHYAVKPRVPERLHRMWAARGGHDAASRGGVGQAGDTSPRSRSSETSCKAMARITLPTGRELHISSLSSPVYQHVLETTDADAATFSLEARYPFFDRRLLEFCVGLPMAQKFDGGWTRLILRRAMDGVLPREVQWRTGKSQLSPNLVRQLRERDHALIASVVHDDSSPLWQYTDREALRTTYRAFVSSAANGSDAALTLYHAAVLGHWLRSGPRTPRTDSRLAAAS
jgi:asparagine synthase (glutamine-hydrolysing)